mmetsp:Transcript_18978/g.21269  ORF Transcript_18978/g.21269 Transcript_18978/m.21269 type:complete len:118 (+) Transcript_18978:27-380(+)
MPSILYHQFPGISKDENYAYFTLGVTLLTFDIDFVIISSIIPLQEVRTNVYLVLLCLAVSLSSGTLAISILQTIGGDDINKQNDQKKVYLTPYHESYQIDLREELVSTNEVILFTTA